jgi:aminoglycoside-2''-adenylyltransferase
MPHTETAWGIWDPATPSEVHRLFAGVSTSWWLAGGYAIELAVGRPLRDHADIDVLLLRRDQEAVRDALAGWELWAADPPGVLRLWHGDEQLPITVHDIWCRPGPDRPWRIQIMLDESAGGEWLSRRNPSLRRPISTLGRTSADGIRFLAPEIQLFYKAKTPRPKDETDFAAILPHLDTTQRRWLAEAITITYRQHPWLPLLASTTCS